MGIVRNRIKLRRDMPLTGVPSCVVVAPRCRPALEGLRAGMHVWVLCWLHRADRSVLRAIPRKISPALGPRGVFAMRSPDRPNPLSLQCARITSLRAGTLRLDWLDAIDGTPVVDLKPYAPGIDSVFFARVAGRARKYALMADGPLRALLLMVVRRTCGRLGRQARLAAELTLRYIRAAGRAPEDGVSRLETSLSGDGIDALHSLFAIRPSAAIVRRTAQARTPWLAVSRGRKRWRVALM